MLDHLDITHPMSPRNPRNRLMRFINEFHYEEDEPYEGNHVVAVRPALIGTFFFSKGYTPEVKARIVECFDYFYEQFQPHIKAKAFSADFTSMTAKGYAKARNKALGMTAPHQLISWEIGSEASQYRAATHSINCLTRDEWDEEKKGYKSWLRFTLPADLLTEDQGRAIYHQLVTFICGRLTPLHGYGGLGVSLPQARHRYEMNEYALSERFIGMEVDAGSFSLGRFLKNHYIKGVNWYTWFDDGFVAKLGGEQTICDYFAGWPAITLHRYPGGLIIQAGDTPDLGDPSDTTEPYRGAPALYVVVNHLIKPIRYPNLGSLHTHHEDEPTLNDDSTTAWQRRFDDLPLPPRDPAAPPLSDLASSSHQPELNRCDGGQPCPQAGYWWTPARQDSGRLFKQGEIMADYPHSSYGSTIWQRKPDDSEQE